MKVWRELEFCELRRTLVKVFEKIFVRSCELLLRSFSFSQNFLHKFLQNFLCAKLCEQLTDLVKVFEKKSFVREVVRKRKFYTKLFVNFFFLQNLSPNFYYSTTHPTLFTNFVELFRSFFAKLTAILEVFGDKVGQSQGF